MIASGVSTFWTFIAGPINDICLRKVPLTVSALLACLFLGLCPETAPSLTLFTINRTIIAICMTQMHSAPLIMDYIKHESRGKATAINSLGHLLGESFAMAVLFSISSNGRFTEAESFAINACIIACMAAPLFCLVRNVEIKKPLAEPAAASFGPDTETSVNNNAPADVP